MNEIIKVISQFGNVSGILPNLPLYLKENHIHFSEHFKASYSLKINSTVTEYGISTGEFKDCIILEIKTPKGVVIVLTDDLTMCSIASNKKRLRMFIKTLFD